MENIVYLNGKFLPLAKASISPMDRGFLFADGIYEVIPVYSQKLFRIAEHLRRLKRSLIEIELWSAVADLQWENILNDLINQNSPQAEQAVYIQITRGAAAYRDFPFPQQTKPTIFAYCMPINRQTIEKLAKGVEVITLRDIRWQRCDIKSVALLASVLLRHQASKKQATEAILLNEKNEILEGTSSNVFIIKNQTIYTPPLSNHILGGITRELVLELAHNNSIPYVEKLLTREELFIADEVWISSSTREIVPVLKCDGHPIADGKVGKLWHKIIEIYQEFKNQLINNKISS